MAVRNFWIDARIDGRKTRLASGPRRKDGGFDLTISIRERGQITRALSVRGIAEADGALTLWVIPRAPDLSQCPIHTGNAIEPGIEVRSRR